MISNRVELLLDLIFSDKDIAEKAFDALVPKYQSELYALYNILNESNVLHKCELTITNALPLSDDENLNINIDLSISDKASVLKYIEDHGEVLKPFRNSNPIKFEIVKNLTGLNITFN